MILLVSYKSGCSLFPTYQENKNGKIKRKPSAKVRCFACANCLLAIQDSNVPTGLLKYNESSSEIIVCHLNHNGCYYHRLKTTKKMLLLLSQLSDTVVEDTCQEIFCPKSNFNYENGVLPNCNSLNFPFNSIRLIVLSCKRNTFDSKVTKVLNCSNEHKIGMASC